MRPVRSHFFDQLCRRETRRKITCWYGARGVCGLFFQVDFDELQEKHGNFTGHVALSDALAKDNWEGHTGFIHQVLIPRDHPAPEESEYYICGPPPMLAAVLKNAG
jgi:Na+-transporting NADH:ubiquinone oxidoreductase subunit F